MLLMEFSYWEVPGLFAGLKKIFRIWFYFATIIFKCFKIVTTYLKAQIVRVDGLPSHTHRSSRLAAIEDRGRRHLEAVPVDLRGRVQVGVQTVPVHQVHSVQYRAVRYHAVRGGSLPSNPEHRG